MTLILRFINFIFKSNKKKEKSSFTSKEDLIGTRHFLQDIEIIFQSIPGKIINFARKVEKKSAGNFTGI